MFETIIYLRTSTEEQNPENQLKSCLELTKKLTDKEPKVFTEQMSAWKKDINRPEFSSIEKLIKENKVRRIVVFDLDRLYRNRKRLIAFFKYCKVYKCDIYSVRQEWLQQLKDIPSPFDEMVGDLMLQLMGWMAEDEVNKLSQRIKNSVRTSKKGITVSRLGNKWGRKNVETKRLISKVRELRAAGLSFRQIRDHEEVYYYDKNQKKKKVSLGKIHNILSS